MPRLRRSLVVAAALSALSLTAAAGSATASGHGRDDHHSGDRGVRFAVIGDIPYGADQIAAFPGWIDEINAARPAFTLHLGDIKNGSSLCEDSYYSLIRSDVDGFRNPFVYTPGDNEWTDCHRTTNGAYNPLERLAFDRSIFFDRPGVTLGQHPMRVDSQVRQGFPENVTFSRAGVQFAMVHVVGSNDGLQPWTGLGETTTLPEQTAAESARMANAVHVVEKAFTTARRQHSSAVVIGLQADMFDPTYTPTWDDISAFQPLVQALVDQSSRFRGSVYLLNGDSHTYHVDQPLAAGSSWLTTYGVTGSADNLTRVTVDGSGNNVDWLEVTVHPRGHDVLTWERVPYAS